MLLLIDDVPEDLFANGDDFSWTAIVKGRNAYFQKQMADQILRQVDEATSLLTDALGIHLNVGQNFTMHTSSSFLALGKVSMETFSHPLLSQMAGGAVLLPPSLFPTNQSSSGPVSSRVRLSFSFDGCVISVILYYRRS